MCKSYFHRNQGPSIVTNQQIYQVSPYFSKLNFKTQILDFVLTYCQHQLK